MPEFVKRNDLITQCITFLSSKGIAIEKTDDTYVFFNYAILGKTLHLAFAANENNDFYFCRFIVPKIEFNEDKEKLIERLNQITSTYKVGKAVLVEDKVWLSVESFVYSTENIQLLYDRLFNLLMEMYNEYMTRKQEK